jgi:hypothetical protein
VHFISSSATQKERGAGELESCRGNLIANGRNGAIAMKAVPGLLLVLLVLGSDSIALAEDKDPAKREGKAAGILIDKKSGVLTVKADGEAEPMKYLVGTDTKLADSLKGIFDASRVQLTYRQHGESRQLVSIKKQVLKTSGTVTGAVVKVYNDFWVEVKPKTGLAGAYAPGPATYNNKEFMDRLKALKPGDLVTIKYSTDFERHRIETLRKNENGSK